MSEIQVNTINEYTSANGVTIDGLSVKDGVITAGSPIKEADMWRRNAEEDLSSNAVLANHWERADTDGATYIGTGLTQSSGVFTFLSTGVYHIHYHFFLYLRYLSNDNRLFLLVIIFFLFHLLNL